MKKILGIGQGVLLGLALGACGSSSQAPVAAPAPAPPVPEAAGVFVTPPTFEGPVARATCASGDVAEPALQGQVPIELRAAGFTGFNCNTELVGQYQGDGAGWQHAWFEDCAYYGTAEVFGVTAGGLANPQPKPRTGPRGVVVVDVSDSSNPQVAGYLDSPAMLDPWESLKVNEPRKLLAAVNGSGGGGGPELDIYDLSEGCKQPRLLSTTAVGTAVGHAGHFAPDGMTYYGSPIQAGIIKAMDISDPTQPKLLTESFPTGTHDLSISDDGNRAFLANDGGNGLTIMDVSEIQQRKPNPQPRIVSELYWDDGMIAQMTQFITIRGREYILFVDELGRGAARIIDITDEKNPNIASKLKLDVHMPDNMTMTAEADGVPFGYDGHYCTASDGVNENTTYSIRNAVIAVCGYFQSGIRVFDIRDPYLPREIAYYNPPANPGFLSASNYNASGICGTVDWASSHPRYRPDTREIWFTSQCNGFQVIRLTKPLAELLGPAPAPRAASANRAATAGNARFGGSLSLYSTLFMLCTALLVYRRGARLHSRES